MEASWKLAFMDHDPITSYQYNPKCKQRMLSNNTNKMIDIRNNLFTNLYI